MPTSFSEKRTDSLAKRWLPWNASKNMEMVSTNTTFLSSNKLLCCSQRLDNHWPILLVTPPPGLPAVINVIPSKSGLTYDGETLTSVVRRLEEAGAAAVGLNCSFGPATIVDVIKTIREACKV